MPPKLGLSAGGAFVARLETAKREMSREGSTMIDHRTGDIRHTGVSVLRREIIAIWRRTW